MLSTTTRPMTDEERKILERRLELASEPFFNWRSENNWKAHAFVLGLGFFFGGLAGLAFGVILAFTLAYMGVIGGQAILWPLAMPGFGGALIGSIGLEIWSGREYQKRKAKSRNRLSRELDEGTVEVVHVRTTQAIRCKLLELEMGLPRVLLFQIGDGQILWLQGEYLRKVVKPDVFPNTHFELIRGVHTREVYSINCKGEPLRLTPFDDSDIFKRECYIPRDGEVIQGNLETLDADLRELKERRRHKTQASENLQQTKKDKNTGVVNDRGPLRTPKQVIESALSQDLRDKKGTKLAIRLAPGLSPQQMAELEKRLPGPVPKEISELLAWTSGFDFAPVDEGVDFTGKRFEGEGGRELFPCGITIARDGFGNFWVVDVRQDNGLWGPVFFVCHDPPFIILQAANLTDFLRQVFHMGRVWDPKVGAAPGGPFHDWLDAPDLVEPITGHRSTEPAISAFAKELPETYKIVDLRKAEEGSGFEWAFPGSGDLRRHRSELLFGVGCRSKKRPSGRLFSKKAQ